MASPSSPPSPPSSPRHASASRRAVDRHLDRPPVPFTAATVVCSSRALPDPLASTISTFVSDVSCWNVDDACKRGNLLLLERIIDFEAVSTHPLYRAHIFGKVVASAVVHDNAIELLKCLDEYSPTGFAGIGMAEACRCGNVRAMQWLFTNGRVNDVRSRIYAVGAAEAGHMDVLQWLKTHARDGTDQLLAEAIGPAASEGHFEIVKWLYENVAADAISEDAHIDALYYVIKAGDLAMVQFVRSQQPSGFQWPSLYNTRPFDIAVTSGNLELIKWLHSNGCPVSDDAIYDTVEVDVINWLLANPPTSRSYTQSLRMAARRGRLDVLELLLSRDPRMGSYSQELYGASESGNLEAVQWLYYNRRSGDRTPERAEEVAVGIAAECGHMKVAQWLHGQRQSKKRPQYDISGALQYRHFESVKWLVESSGEHGPAHDLDSVVSTGNLEMVVWLHQNSRTTCTTDAMNSAAGLNDLDIVQWLHENRSEGCTTDAMDNAAENGYIEVIQWLHDNRCEGCTSDAMDNAAMNNHLDIVQWLDENRDEGCTSNAIDSAAAKGNFEVIQWLHENRTECCTAEALDNAGSIDMTMWLHENCDEGSTTAAMDNAAERGDVDVLLFLHEYRSEGCTIQAAVNAHDNYHMDIFEWLVQTYPDIMNIEDLRELIEDNYFGFRSPLLTKVDSVKRQRTS